MPVALVEARGLLAISRAASAPAASLGFHPGQLAFRFTKQSLIVTGTFFLLACPFVGLRAVNVVHCAECALHYVS